MQTFVNERNFNLERVIVYKRGERPTESESQEIILTALSQELDFTLSIVKHIIEQNRVIPFLELKKWDISHGQIEKSDIDSENPLAMILRDEYIVKMVDSNVYKVVFILSGKKEFGVIRLFQRWSIKKLLDLFCSGNAGPHLGNKELEFSSKVVYELFTPGRFIDKDVWISDDTIISPKAVFFPPVLIGKGCWIEDNVVVGPGVIMALNSKISQGTIISQSIVFRVKAKGHNMIQNVFNAKDLFK